MTEQELILTNILDCDRTELYLNKPLLNKEQSEHLEKILFLRKQGLPLQYLLGECEFMGLNFKVNKDVFIPRPETEILVETAIKLVSSVKFKVSSILDIGTGSGCIAISLAKFLKNVKVYATDISKEALEVARQNASLNNVEITFLEGDLFSNCQLQTINYELIVSNPPYIPSQEIDRLQAEVRQEPHIALNGGRDGLDFYRRLIKESPRYLKDDGFLIMEMGYNQAEPIKKMIATSEFKLIEIVNDYSNIERIVVLKLERG